MPCNALSPVRLLRDEETVKVRYLDSGQEVQLHAGKPVEVLNSVSANDDATHVEVMDLSMVAVRQFDEFGEPHTIMLSPRMAMELARLLDSFVFLGPSV